VKSKKAT